MNSIKASYLIVDDDMFTLEILTRILKKIGIHKIEMAGNGKEAMQVLQKKRLIA